MAAVEPILTNIAEMIDLAIGTPEVGVVDFCMLQTVLHCLAQQLHVLGKNVELRGSMATMPVGRQADNAQTIAISEFIIDTGAPGQYELATGPPSPDQDSVLVELGSPVVGSLTLTHVTRPARSSVDPVERKRKNDPEYIAMIESAKATPAASQKSGGPSTPGSNAPTPATGPAPASSAYAAATATAPSAGTAAPARASSADAAAPTSAPSAGAAAPTSAPSAGAAAPAGAPSAGAAAPAGAPSAGAAAPAGAPSAGAAAPAGAPSAGAAAPAGAPSAGAAAPAGAPSAGAAAPAGAPSAGAAAPAGAPTAGAAAARPPSSPPARSSVEKLSLVTLSKFNLLENTVADLKDRVYGTSPKNEAILEEVRSQGNLKAITDMWNNMNVASRLDAAEEGIRKLSSLIEDLIGEAAEMQNRLDALPSSPGSPSGQGIKAALSQPGALRSAPSQPAPLKSAPLKSAPLKSAKSQPAPGAPAPRQYDRAEPGVQIQYEQIEPVPFHPSPSMIESWRLIDSDKFASRDELNQVVDHLQSMRDDLDGLTKSFANAMKDLDPTFVPPPLRPPMRVTLVAPPTSGEVGPGGVGPGGVGPGGVGQGGVGPGGVGTGGVGPGGVGPGGVGPGGVGPGGVGPGGVGPGGVGPGGVGPGGVGPGGVGPGGVGPGGVGPGGVGPGGVGPGGVGPGGVGPGGVGPGGVGPGGVGPGGVGPGGVGPGGVGPGGVGSGGVGPGGVGPGGVGPGGVGPGGVGPGGVGPGGVGPWGVGPGGVGPGGVGAGRVGSGGVAAGGEAIGFSATQTVYLAQMEGRLQERLVELEKEMKKCCDEFHKSEGLIKDQLNSFQDQLEATSREIAIVAGQGDGKLTPDLVKDLQGLMKLFETVQNMKVQLQQVHETALNLATEKDSRQYHTDALLEQIELLKVIKLDREDMVEALADKADLRMLARKVSHDQFENACDDLSKGLEQALGKLNVQESLWQQALDDIQREIEQKLDKMELSPVKDFFNNKLKQLQENLKAMAALRREAEAAGTKRRLLRDVNCISCDAKAVMAMDPIPPQPPKPLPASLSMKPYLSYELDAIRKNQASSLPQRNMHDWENVQQQMQPTKPYRVRSETDKHLCNRYCGGSHTVTTPAQRVARLGHFIKQWGPEVLPLSSGFAAGDDGRLYKISTSEGASVGPGGALGAAISTPKSPSKKPEPPRGHDRPIVISAECRCLDPTAELPPPKN